MSKLWATSGPYRVEVDTVRGLLTMEKGVAPGASIRLDWLYEILDARANAERPPEPEDDLCMHCGKVAEVTAQWLCEECRP